MRLTGPCSAALVVLVASVSSCHPGDDTARAHTLGAGTTDEAVSLGGATNRGGVVRFAFAPDPNLRAALDTVFASLARRRRATPELSEATLHQFAVDSADNRFVLLARLVPSESAPLRQWGWAFIAIERDAAGWQLSPAYDFKAEENLAVVGIRDVDSDESADVIYCAWYEGQDERVPARALGYRNGRWYEIDRGRGSDAAVKDDCRAEIETVGTRSGR